MKRSFEVHAAIVNSKGHYYERNIRVVARTRNGAIRKARRGFDLRGYRVRVVKEVYQLAA